VREEAVLLLTTSGSVGYDFPLPPALVFTCGRFGYGFTAASTWVGSETAILQSYDLVASMFCFVSPILA